MYLQLGKLGLDCNIEYTKEDFVNKFGKTLALDRLDSSECFKMYLKEHKKLNPKVKKKKK